jgi:hypothetical protein
VVEREGRRKKRMEEVRKRNRTGQNVDVKVRGKAILYTIIYLNNIVYDVAIKGDVIQYCIMIYTSYIYT